MYNYHKEFYPLKTEYKASKPWTSSFDQNYNKSEYHPAAAALRDDDDDDEKWCEELVVTNIIERVCSCLL